MSSPPLGAHPDEAGTSFAVRSPAATSVELCLFDDDPHLPGGRERRLPMQAGDDGSWQLWAPGVGPGQRYGFRAGGPWGPARGQRHDPAKLLTDPYALALDGELSLNAHVLGPSTESRVPGDSAPYVPRSVVVRDTFDWGGDAPPRTPWRDCVVYELHVRGFTARHPDIPPELRGTYAGLAHPAAIEHLVTLGVTAVELLPVQAFVSEPHLLRLGLTNNWGYNTLGFFAPHAAYSASGSRGQQVSEFKHLVRSLHAAGLEVLLDVVYNHTAEGDELGPTLSLRGLDNAGSYRLDPTDPSRYDDVTGTGSTLDLRTAAVRQLVLDSLRYWVEVMHVDGFRFDLAPALARTGDGFQATAPLLQAIGADPVLSAVTLIAEPWDIGPDGYRLGGFPAPWAEWNDRFRDTVRDAWRPGPAGARTLAGPLSGSAAVFAPTGRGPQHSVNFVTAHDGFTLHDLTAYDHKHNHANGEDNRDGAEQNRSWNCGVEGPTDDPAVGRLRRRQARNLLATLLLSAGTPMLSMGDEVRRSQQGNNNAYCQSGEIGWQPWDLDQAARDLHAFTTLLLQWRRDTPALHRDAFFTGEPGDDSRPDIGWYAADGSQLDSTDWADTGADTLVACLRGESVGRAQPAADLPTADLALLIHTGPQDVTVRLPGPPWPGTWTTAFDTHDERPHPDGAPVAGTRVVCARSVVLLQAT